MHPREWRLLASTCSQLRRVVAVEQQLLREQICCEHQLEQFQIDSPRLLVDLAERREAAAALRLIAAGAGVDGPSGKRDRTPLIWAAKNDDRELLQVLISVGCALDLESSRGCTALTFASQHGHTEIVVALVAAGADLDRVNEKGYTALALATILGHERCSGPNQERYSQTVLALRAAGASSIGNL